MDQAMREATATKDGINYRTPEALVAARVARDVAIYVAQGYSRAEATIKAAQDAEALDLIILNPDGTYRFHEPKSDDFLTPSPAALKRSELANATPAAPALTAEGISAETSGTSLDPETTPWGRLIEAFERSGDLHLKFPREYSSWRHAKARVNNPNDKKFKTHGRRGIGMALAWKDSFAAFLKDMGRRPKGTTLERINNAKGYTPGNCKWATVSEQNSNRRGWAAKKRK
jgi:hypothetical protein